MWQQRGSLITVHGCVRVLWSQFLSFRYSPLQGQSRVTIGPLGAPGEVGPGLGALWLEQAGEVRWFGCEQ